MTEAIYRSRRILVLNYNGAVDTIECVRSVLANGNIGRDEVLVIDNGSTDDSLCRIRAEFPYLRYIENKANLGYAEGFNVAMRSLEGEKVGCFLLLNNDTRVHSGTIEALEGTLYADSSVGVVGPAILEMGSRVVQSLGATMNWRRGGSDSRYAGSAYDSVPHAVEGVDYVSGCAMLVDAKALREVGYFDTKLFMYSEEVDACLRISRHGYKVLCDSRVTVEHRGQATSKRYPGIRNHFITRNRVIVMKRYAPARYLVEGLLWMLLYEVPMVSLRSTARREPVKGILARWMGLLDGMVSSLGEPRLEQMKSSKIGAI